MSAMDPFVARPLAQLSAPLMPANRAAAAARGGGAQGGENEGYAIVLDEVHIREPVCRSQQLVPATMRVLCNVLPNWMSRTVVSPHADAAAAALSLCGVLSCVCTTWRDAIREALGLVAAQLAPGILELGPTSWAALQRRPWALQLRLVMRRVNLVRVWDNVQELRGLCTLVHGGVADTGPRSVTEISYCTWTLSRESVLSWMSRLFEFVSVCSVASLGRGANARVTAEEMERARQQIVVSFAGAVADRLCLEPYEDAVRAYPAARTAQFYWACTGPRRGRPAHGYEAEVAGLRAHVASLASGAWEHVALDAALPLHDSRPSGLVQQLSMQHSDLAQLCQRSDPRVSTRLDSAARGRVRTTIQQALRRASRPIQDNELLMGEDGLIQQEQTQVHQREQTELLDDSLMLDIVGTGWLDDNLSRLRGGEITRSAVLDALRQRFRDPSVFACAKLWELSAQTQPFLSATSVATVASIVQKYTTSVATAASVSAAVEGVGLRLHGLSLLGARWPECSTRLRRAHHVLTPPRDLDHLQQNPPPATNVRSKRSGTNLIDMRPSLSGPRHCHSRAVRTLTRDLQRVWRQAADLHLKGLPVVVAEPATLASGGVDLSVWRGLMHGPRDSPWEGGLFEFEMQFPLDDYPQKPPMLRFMPLKRSQRNGSVRSSSRLLRQQENVCCVFHPNVDERGFVCADVLTTEWSSVCSVATLLLSVQSILDDPSCDHPANVEAASLLVQNRDRYIHIVRCRSRQTQHEAEFAPTQHLF